jgi:predicted acetyltransferase
MAVEIRSCRPDEFHTFLQTCEAAFGHLVKDDTVERHRRIMSSDRMFAAFEGDVMVGTAASFPFTLTVPGGELSASGVTMVGVLPSHRRRGVLTELMRLQLLDAHDRGEPVAVLWASEGAIYGRFGYGVATRQCEMNIERDRALFRGSPPPQGRTRLVNDQEAAEVLPEVYERVRRATPGMYARSLQWWQAHTLPDAEEERGGGGPIFRALWEIDDRAEAYAFYRVHSGWDEGMPSGWLEVEEAVATSPVATREIWRFLFGVDLVSRVRTHFLPLSHPLFHMLREPRRLRLAVKDGLHARVVDLPAALAARSYGADGTLVLEVADPLCSWNEGRWRLEAFGGSGRVHKTSDPPDARLTAEELGAVYLGGVGLAELAQAGRVEELRPGAVREATHMFAGDIPPWCPEVF